MAGKALFKPRLCKPALFKPGLFAGLGFTPIVVFDPTAPVVRPPKRGVMLVPPVRRTIVAPK